MVVTQCEQFGSISGGLMPVPEMTYLTFPSRNLAEAARTKIEAAKLPNVTVVALYGEQ